MKNVYMKSFLKQICLALFVECQDMINYKNKKNLTKKEEKELKDCINRKHWGLID
jgi:hypothetical protein